jgi:hypothetical protein
MYMQDYKIVSPCLRPKDGTARFRPAERKAELHLLKTYGTAFECRAQEVSVDVRWRFCGRKMEIFVAAAWYSSSTIQLYSCSPRRGMPGLPAVMQNQASGCGTQVL